MHGAYERTWSGDTQGVMSGMARGLNLDKIAFNFRYSSDNVARSNPWSRILLSGDFILIAEFAENEGPKPVVSLTDYINAFNSLDYFRVIQRTVQCHKF